MLGSFGIKEKMRNFEFFLGKITIRSLFSFWNLIRKSKRIATEKQFSQ